MSSSASPILDCESSQDPPARSPLRELMWLAFPTVLQMLAYTVEQFTDAFMLSRVGDIHATAAGNAGMVAFTTVSFGFGVLLLVNALVSEEYGAKRFANAGPRLWQGIWFAIAYSAMMLPSLLFARQIFTALHQSAELVPLEAAFFNVMTGLLVLKMLSMALGQFMLAVNRPMVVFWAASAGMVANIAVNIVLIFGRWGIPAMGVRGAAWGTNSAIFVELLVVGIVAFRPHMRRTYNLLAARFDRARFRELMRIGIPSGFQTMGDVIAWTLFFVYVMGVYGTKAQAANTYMLQYMRLSFMPAFGLSGAVTALVARYIGAGKPDVSEHRAHLGFKVAAIYMGTCGVVFWLLSGTLMRFFTADPEIIRLGSLLFFFCACFQFFDAMFVVYIGALRGVKDTFVPACVQIALTWTLLVGGGIGVSYLRPQWGVAGPWTVTCVNSFLLGMYLQFRFRSGKWKRQAFVVADKREAESVAATGSVVSADSTNEVVRR